MANDNRPLSPDETNTLLDALSTHPPDTNSPPATDEPSSPTDPEDNAEAVESKSPKPPPSRPARSSLDDPRLRRTLHLPVTLFVGLGEKRLTIGSLLGWGIGTQIVLDREWQRDVSIKLNGLAVGEGRVVIVGNNFGVEVTNWGKKK